MRRMIERIDEILNGVTSAFGAAYQFDHSTLPACVNDEACARIVESAADAVLGEGRTTAKRITGSDDMAYFLERAPGAYFLLGARPDGELYPHHHPKFDFNEDCIPLGIEVGLRIVEAATGSSLN